MPQSFADELSSIPMSPGLGESLERAHRFAREQSHRVVTLEHLLLALTEDSEAALILQSANIELARLSTDVSGYLGRLLEDMRSDGTSEPRPDADLLRVLQAAASAAKQSRRRQIDGAIVLAAIVGDGKSPAAGLLKALGMTFEEAIRALQRANTKARLKPAPKSPEAAPSPPRAPAEPPAAEPAPEASDAAREAPSPAAPAAAGVSQSAEEILAAARARIQQRAAAAPKTEPARREEKPRAEASTPVAAAAAENDTPPPMAANPAATDALAEAIEAAMSGSAPRTVERPPPSDIAPAPPAPLPQPAAAPAPPLAAPPAPPIAQQAQPTRAPWAPPPEPPRAAPAQRLPQPPPGRPQPPLPARLVAPGEGPRRPPLPPPSAGQPQLGFPNRPPRAPWPEPGERRPPVRPPLPNGTYAEAPPAPPLAPAVKPPSPQRGAGHADKSLLVESVPRRMRMGVPASAEVRIARDRIEALIATLSTRGSTPLAEQPLMRALSVRLRAPGGDFWIEPAAPETQWVDSASSLIHDDYAIWRWTVVARRRGRGRLTLMVSARTVGRDGVAAETAPPDRVIDVKIATNYAQVAKRWVAWIIALLAGALIGYFSEPIWALADLVLQRAL